MANLQTFEINFVPPVKPEVFLRKIVANDADQFDRAEKARGDRGVAGRTAQQTRAGRVRCFDGVQCSRADNENAHLF